MASAASSSSVLKDVQVAIVGAGVAGLQCAQTLLKAGVTSVVVLEATSVVGGRVRPDATFMRHGKEIELGAEFLHGDRTMLADIVKDLGLRSWSLCTWAQGDGGPLEEPAPDGGISYYYLGDESKLLTYETVNEDKDLNLLHEKLTQLYELDPEDFRDDPRTLLQYLRDEGVPSRVMDMADAGYANTMGGTLQQLGLSQTANMESQFASDGDNDARLEPSSRVLLEALAKGLDIRLNWPVRRIAVRNGRARLTCGNGATLRAQRVVVTASVAVLRDGLISFSPQLKSSKRAALGRVYMTPALKVLLKFKARCWPTNCHGCICANSFVPEMWMNATFTPATPADSPRRKVKEMEYLVTCFATGPRCAAIAALPTATVLARVLAQLDSVFASTRKAGDPTPSQAFLSGTMHVWNARNEPWVRGAYCPPVASEPPWARKALLEPHAGCVYFAGEATSGARPVRDSPVTLHGAMITGASAAQDVVASLRDTGTGTGPAAAAQFARSKL